MNKQEWDVLKRSLLSRVTIFYEIWFNIIAITGITEENLMVKHGHVSQ